MSALAIDGAVTYFHNSNSIYRSRHCMKTTTPQTEALASGISRIDPFADYITAVSVNPFLK